MFPNAYFAGLYFADRYFPPSGDLLLEDTSMMWTPEARIEIWTPRRRQGADD